MPRERSRQLHNLERQLHNQSGQKSNAFYGKFAPVFSNLFEVLYICVMCVAPAVAFATGGATLSTLTGLPYLLCTLIIGIFIFIVAIFGTDLARRVASVLSICIIAGPAGDQSSAARLASGAPAFIAAAA